MKRAEISYDEWTFRLEENYLSAEEEPSFDVNIQGNQGGGYGSFKNMNQTALQAFFDCASAVCRIKDKIPNLVQPSEPVRNPMPINLPIAEDPEGEIVERTLAVERGLRMLALTWKVENDVAGGPRAELVYDDLRADVVPFVDGVWCWKACGQSGTSFSFKTAMLSASESVIGELERRGGDAERRLGG